MVLTHSRPTRRSSDLAGGWQNVVWANAHNDRYRQFPGKNFAEIGKALGKDPADAAWDIWLAALPARAGALYFLMDDADIDLAMKQPWVSIGTEAAVRPEGRRVGEEGVS